MATEVVSDVCIYGVFQKDLYKIRGVIVHIKENNIYDGSPLGSHSTLSSIKSMVVSDRLRTFWIYAASSAWNILRQK